MRFPIQAVVLGLMLLAKICEAADGQDTLTPLQHWGGIIKESAKKTAAPKSKLTGQGYLKDQDALEKLFDAWGLKEKPPKIDFKRLIVFVKIASGPNLPRVSFQLNAAGELSVKAIQTLIGGPGFGYSIDVLDRTGIKTYQDEPLE